MLFEMLFRTQCREIPCGIYGDKTRIDLLYEHTATIEKSMKQIAELAGKTDAQSLNQKVRWINNKEEHAKEVQYIVMQYFMTQRVKRPADGDAPAMEKYHQQLAAFDAIATTAMKGAQSTDPASAEALFAAIDVVAPWYPPKE